MDKQKKEKFQGIKSKVLKKYPEAHTMMDSSGNYFVADVNNRDILNLPILDNLQKTKINSANDIAVFLRKTPTIPHSSNVYDAWAKLEMAINAHRIIGVNSDRFSSEKSQKGPHNYE